MCVDCEYVFACVCVRVRVWWHADKVACKITQSAAHLNRLSRFHFSCVRQVFTQALSYEQFIVLVLRGRPAPSLAKPPLRPTRALLPDELARIKQCFRDFDRNRSSERVRVRGVSGRADSHVVCAFYGLTRVYL